MNPTTLIFALHGFLGLPKDFEAFDNALARGIELVPVDYTLTPGLDPSVPLEQWGANFNSWVQEYMQSRKDLREHSPRKVLLGYSQGGRLALHVLKDNAKPWDLAVIVSANPGIPEDEKQNRHISDKNWSLKFLTGDFKSVVKEWNDQSVFKGSEEPPRLGEDYSRQALSKALMQWSVCEQADLRAAIKDMQIKVLWVSGERDKKYSLIGQEMATLNNNVQTVLIPNAGHRVLFDQPKVLAGLIK